MGGVVTYINDLRKFFVKSDLIIKICSIFDPLTLKILNLSGPDTLFIIIVLQIIQLSYIAFSIAIKLLELIIVYFYPICKSVQSIESEQYQDNQGNLFEKEKYNEIDEEKKLELTLIKGNKKLKYQMLTFWMILIIIDNIKILFISIPLIYAYQQIFKTAILFIMMIPLWVLGGRTGCEILQIYFFRQIIKLFEKDLNKIDKSIYSKIKSNVEIKCNSILSTGTTFKESIN